MKRFFLLLPLTLLAAVAARLSSHAAPTPPAPVKPAPRNAQPAARPAATRPAATGIAWNARTLTHIADGTYGRMARLQNGAILCSFEAGGKAWVARSTDEGKTWSNPVLVREIAGANASNAELLPLRNGRVLLFYNQRPHDPALHFAIGMCWSDDGGATWQPAPKLIYEAAAEGANGCWEPAAMQLSSGEIQLFFANEFPYQKSDEQETTLMRSLDNGKTWRAPETASFRAGHRDGMPVPLRLQNGTRIFSIEDNGLAPGYALQPAIISSPRADNWRGPAVAADSPRRWGAITPPLAGGIYAGAPYVRQVPNGETVLSCQITEEGREKPHMVVYVGNSEARDFGHKSVPFETPGTVGGWWNSLFVKGDDTVTAISETVINGRSGIWAIDGHITREAAAQ